MGVAVGGCGALRGRRRREAGAVAAALLGWVIVGMLGLPCGGRAEEPSGSPTVDAVLGIISFSHWPTMRASLVMCMVGSPEHADQFTGSPILVSGIRIRPRRMFLLDDRLGLDCDIVLEGRISLPDRQEINRRLEGRPALTIGEPAPGCSEATMFCLRERAGGVSVTTNIDMVARSGLRVSPRVLMLGRTPAANGT